MIAQANGMFQNLSNNAGVEIWNKSWATADKQKLESNRSAQVEKLVNKLGYKKGDGQAAFPGKAVWK